MSIGGVPCSWAHRGSCSVFQASWFSLVCACCDADAQATAGGRQRALRSGQAARRARTGCSRAALTPRVDRPRTPRASSLGPRSLASNTHARRHSARVCVPQTRGTKRGCARRSCGVAHAAAVVRAPHAPASPRSPDPSRRAEVAVSLAWPSSTGHRPRAHATPPVLLVERPCCCRSPPEHLLPPSRCCCLPSPPLVSSPPPPHACPASPRVGRKRACAEGTGGARTRVLGPGILARRGGERQPTGCPRRPPARASAARAGPPGSSRCAPRRSPAGAAARRCPSPAACR